MAWNSKTYKVTFDEAVETIWINLQLPHNDFNKENIKFMIGGIPDKGIYTYVSKEALKIIQETAPELVTEKGIKYNTNNAKLKGKLTIEHTVPNAYVIDYLYDLSENITKDTLIKILSTLVCTLITKEEDARLNQQYRSKMPNAWTFNDNIWERYEKNNIDIINILEYSFDLK